MSRINGEISFFFIQKLWENEKGKAWTKNVKDLKYGVLIISQFTLFASIRKNKPSYHRAARPEIAEEFYNKFVELMRKMHHDVQTGVFGAQFSLLTRSFLNSTLIFFPSLKKSMTIQAENDGPVTIPIEVESNKGKESGKDDEKGDKEEK